MPSTDVEGVAVAGANLALDRACEGHGAAAKASAQRAEGLYRIEASWPKPERSGSPRGIDFQNDVTLKDVALAGVIFVSVEHLKRYTTLGISRPIRQTLNVNGLEPRQRPR